MARGHLASHAGAPHELWVKTDSFTIELDHTALSRRQLRIKLTVFSFSASGATVRRTTAIEKQIDFVPTRATVLRALNAPESLSQDAWELRCRRNNVLWTAAKAAVEEVYLVCLAIAAQSEACAQINCVVPQVFAQAERLALDNDATVKIGLTVCARERMPGLALLSEGLVGTLSVTVCRRHHCEERLKAQRRHAIEVEEALHRTDSARSNASIRSARRSLELRPTAAPTTEHVAIVTELVRHDPHVEIRKLRGALVEAALTMSEFCGMTHVLVREIDEHFEGWFRKRSQIGHAFAPFTAEMAPESKCGMLSAITLPYQRLYRKGLGGVFRMGQ